MDNGISSSTEEQSPPLLQRATREEIHQVTPDDKVDYETLAILSFLLSFFCGPVAFIMAICTATQISFREKKDGYGWCKLAIFIAILNTIAVAGFTFFAGAVALGLKHMY